MKNPNNKTLGERSQDKERSPDKERCQDKERSEDREKSEDKRRSGDIERSADRERSREQGVILSLSNSYRSLQYYNINYSEQIYIPVSVPVYYGNVPPNPKIIGLRIQYIPRSRFNTLIFPVRRSIPPTIYRFRHL
ncbi:uncharacterized protein LOC100578464 [Apis mellifera]|uniref:Uncharacterized protein LOC100578464 n=1 Tax=Apis mellifera TaxID=7460 RepID=A0A7M7KZZ7_APIME|nr:uncharacterized protein LOC100578464 [Apis mellifera]|eukprot:XP_026295220.1 uncharacterized protein LOC100578464 [Apis mellifera]